MSDAATAKTAAAFAVFRAAHAIRACKLVPRNEGELVEMTNDLDIWVDGPGDAEKGQPPEISAYPAGARLWVVRQDDVVHAEEKCAFGKALASGVIKHTNLTAGASAYAGGELLFLEPDTIAITADSGRYGPESDSEMTDIAKAFRDSGYGVWNYGYDDELKVPFRFGAKFPDWVL